MPHTFSRVPAFLRRCLLVCYLAALLASPAFGQTPDAGRPNVLLILADDMGLGDLSRFNEGRSRTPRLDRLVDESAWFSRAYSASSVCAPARAALLTGRYPHRTGVVTLNPERFPHLNRLYPDEVTIADLFAENGYATGLVGKWHVGDGDAYHPMKRGFQEFAGSTFMARDVPSYFKYELDVNGTMVPFEDKYLTDEFTERAIDFVRRHQGEPFFLHLAHYAPHRPLEAPQEAIDSYLARGFDEDTATIYAMIEIMDRGIGAVLDELDALGLRDDTIVIFASDNGPDPLTETRFNVDMRGTKYTMYEGGIHVPLMIRWPGQFAPSTHETIVHFTDIVPTLVELCHLDAGTPLALDGASLAGLLRGTTSTLPERRFWQWNRGVPHYSHNAAVREGPWKLVRPYVTRNLVEGESDARPVLYNLQHDPDEQHDVSADHPGLYERLNAALQDWSEDVEADRLRGQ